SGRGIPLRAGGVDAQRPGWAPAREHGTRRHRGHPIGHAPIIETDSVSRRPSGQPQTGGAAMKVTRLGEHIGAEVTGIDLRKPVDAETRRALNAAVVENVALVIRGQEFTPEQYLAAV